MKSSTSTLSCHLMFLFFYYQSFSWWYTMSRWPSAEPWTDSTVSPCGWRVIDYTHTHKHTLRCTDKHSLKRCWSSDSDSYNFKLSISIAPPDQLAHTTVHTHTHLGRLGRGEVKPGRDKVMLRHLGPVFPVSGSRHQTSWPGSNKRNGQKEWQNSDSAISGAGTWISDTESNSLSWRSLSSVLSTFSYFKILCTKVSLKTSQKRLLFLAENNKAQLAAAVPVKLITAWQPGWKISCAA